MRIINTGDSEERDSESSDSDLEGMTIEEFEAEKKRLLEALAKAERERAILLAAAAWDEKRKKD